MRRVIFWMRKNTIENITEKEERDKNKKKKEKEGTL